jgi:fructokinase
MLLARTFEENGVDTKLLLYDSKRRTTLNFHAKLATGEIEYLFYRNPGADTNIKPSELDFACFSSATTVHFDSLCLTDEPLKSTVISLIKELPAIISYDFNYRPTLWENAADALEATKTVLPLIDIIKLNEEELALLAGGKGISEGCRDLLEKGPSLCIITLGGKGCYAATQKYSVKLPAMEVKVADTIGCGDAFIGSFLTYMAQNGIDPTNIGKEELYKCMLFANTAAALTAKRHGAMGALPSKDEVDKHFTERM